MRFLIICMAYVEPHGFVLDHVEPREALDANE